MATNPNANANTNNYYALLMSGESDQDRLTLQHKALAASNRNILTKIMVEYGLENLLQTAASDGYKLRFLDAGCSIGLFLFDLADMLEEWGLLAAVDLYGVDNDAAAISKAEQEAKERGRDRKISFFLHDLAKPLATSPELRGLRATKFDFISSVFVLEHLPNAQQRLSELYSALQPNGGIIYCRDVVARIGEDTWTAPHPILQPFLAGLAAFIRSANGDEVIAEQVGGWLTSSGAVNSASERVTVAVGGGSPTGTLHLKNLVLGVHHAGPTLVKLGYLSQADFKQIIPILHKELTPACTGKLTFIETIAMKP